RIYVDGQLAASNPNVNSWSWDPAEQIELGKSHDTFWRRFDGYLDDVQFYSRTLSAAEVVQSMNLTVGPTLAVSRAGNQLTLSWPSTGFVLEQNTNLANPGGWTAVPGGTTGTLPVTIPP